MNGITLIPCCICGKGYRAKDMIWHMDKNGQDRPFCASCWKEDRAMTPEDFRFKTGDEEIAYNQALIDTHPEIMDLFSDGHNELGIEFLAFMEVYRYAAYRLRGTEIKAIYDFGCNAGIQSVLFPDMLYHGVEVSDCMKMSFRNEFHDIVQRDAGDYLDSVDFRKNPYVFAICSAVPNDEVRKKVAEKFRYHLVTYPTMIESESFPEKVEE